MQFFLAGMYSPQMANGPTPREFLRPGSIDA